MATARTALSLLPLAAAACSSAPPPPPPTPAPSASALPAPPPLPPARWVDQRGGSQVGVRLGARGTLVLVGGKRRLVADDGATTAARGAPDEALDRLERVPAPGGEKIVGFSGREVVRFDDPLGEGVRIATLPGAPAGVSTWPGRIALRTPLGHLVWLDLEGKVVAAPALPLEPTRTQFLDEKRGLAVFLGAGLAHTTDGGATWALVDAAPTMDFDARGDVLRVDRRAVRPSGALEEQPVQPAPPLVRWLRAVELSPLDTAVRSGVDAGGGKALVGVTDEVFEVDLATGDVQPWASLRGAFEPGEGDVEPGLWQGAPVLGAGGARVAAFFTSYGAYIGGFRPVLELALDAKAPRVPRRTQDRTGRYGPPVASTSRGLLVPGPCADDEGYANDVGVGSCVRQPNGTFRTIHARLSEESRGPTAAGGLVGLSEPQADGGLDLVVVSPDGKERTVARACPSLEACTLAAPIDELEPGEYATLVEAHDLAKDGVPPVAALRVSRGAPSREIVSTRFLSHRAYALGRAAVETDEGLLVSVDGAKTFAPIPAPRMLERAEDLAVGELGLAWGGMVRLGWGAPAGEPPAVADEARPATLAFPAAAGGRRIACEPGKARKSLPIFADARAAGLAVVPKRPQGLFPGLPLEHVSGLRAHARLDPHEAPPGQKGQLAFGWIDQTELGAKVRFATGPLPVGFGRERGFLHLVVARGDRAFFAVRYGSTTYFGRASGSKLEVVPAPHKGAPRDAAIGADGAVSFVGDEGVGLWPAKGAPRLLARVRSGGQLAVAAPEKGGVPLLVGERRWAAVRVVPVPKDPAAAPAYLDVAGWRRTALGPSELDALPACGAKAPAHRFVLSSTLLSVAIPGAQKARLTLVAVRADEAGACVDAVTARVGSTGWARVDLAAKKAEGHAEAGAVELTCKLE